MRSSNIALLDQYENETFLLEKAFQYMEKRFVTEYEQTQTSAANNWAEGIFWDMAANLFDYTWNHALSHFYNNEKLIETTERAQDNALDKIFNSLIFDEHYFSEDINIYSVETKLASIYENILKEEFLIQMDFRQWLDLL